VVVFDLLSTESIEGTRARPQRFSGLAEVARGEWLWPPVVNRKGGGPGEGFSDFWLSFGD